jgi:hypothetical protein
MVPLNQKIRGSVKGKKKSTFKRRQWNEKKKIRVGSRAKEKISEVFKTYGRQYERIFWS